MGKKEGTSKEIAWSGVLLALSLCTLYVASIVPGAELTLYALSSIYSAILIIETREKNGWLFFSASLVLSLMLIPNVVAVLPYALFFGPYGPMKHRIESLKKPGVEILFKLIFFNAMMGAGFLIFGELLWSNLGLPSAPFILLVIGAQVFLLLYDKIFTLCIDYYLRRLRKW